MHLRSIQYQTSKLSLNYDSKGTVAPEQPKQQRELYKSQVTHRQHEQAVSVYWSDTNDATQYGTNLTQNRFFCIFTPYGVTSYNPFTISRQSHQFPQRLNDESYFSPAHTHFHL